MPNRIYRKTTDRSLRSPSRRYTLIISLSTTILFVLVDFFYYKQTWKYNETWRLTIRFDYNDLCGLIALWMYNTRRKSDICLTISAESRACCFIVVSFDRLNFYYRFLHCLLCISNIAWILYLVRVVLLRKSFRSSLLSLFTGAFGNSAVNFSGVTNMCQNY